MNQPTNTPLTVPADRIPGPIIAEFQDPFDARAFAVLKRDQGDEVTVTPGVNHFFAVRRLVRL